MAAKQKTTLYQSFLLRLWREKEQGVSTPWCGEIESIQTGQKWQFADLESMSDFLQAQILPGPAEQSDREHD